jgi:hypothetical protein
MIPWLAVGLALVPGSIVAWRRGAAGARLVSETVLWGVFVTAVWMGAMDLMGVRWSVAVLCVPAAVAGLAAVIAEHGQPQRLTTPGRWVLAAAAAALGHAVILAATPSFGWDFRYSWALKAKVYALAGGHDFAWLAWPFHSFARVDYPPLWSDLLAFSGVLGATPGTAAATWQAVLVVGIAATCWGAARPAPPWVRAVAATTGAWVPVIFTPTVAYSGYAEPLLAFGACVALDAILAIANGDDRAWQTAAAGVVLVALSKNEGIALALGVALAAWRVGGRRAVGVPVAALIAIGTWRGRLAGYGIEGFPNVLSPVRIAARLSRLPGAFTAAATWQLCGVVLVWLLALPSIMGRNLNGARIALAVWAAAVLAAYLVSPFDLAWHLRTSLDRVLAVPLPIVLALALRDVAPSFPVLRQPARQVQ